jgi:hypothetical protein
MNDRQKLQKPWAPKGKAENAGDRKTELGPNFLRRSFFTLLAYIRVFFSKEENHMTPIQIKALQAAHTTGTAVDSTKLYRNGAHLRMLNKLVAAGLLDTSYAITAKGKQMINAEPTLDVVQTLPPAGPFRIRSTGEQNGKPWARFHGEPIVSRELAVAKLAELNARTARVYGKQPAPFTFELV